MKTNTKRSTYTGAVYGEFQCGHCGTLYAQPMRWR